MSSSSISFVLCFVDIVRLPDNRQQLTRQRALTPDCSRCERPNAIKTHRLQWASRCAKEQQRLSPRSAYAVVVPFSQRSERKTELQRILRMTAMWFKCSPFGTRHVAPISLSLVVGQEPLSRSVDTHTQKSAHTFNIIHHASEPQNICM